MTSSLIGEFPILSLLSDASTAFEALGDYLDLLDGIPAGAACRADFEQSITDLCASLPVLVSNPNDAIHLQQYANACNRLHDIAERAMLLVFDEEASE